MATPKPVHVTVTSQIVGSWTTAPYSRERHLDISAIYVVPIYRVLVGTDKEFAAIRFGLVNRGQSPAPAQRVCDAGLNAAHVSRPTWVPNYSPHSFVGGIRPGAWVILPGRSFLIHEGTPTYDTTIGGSLGCVEVVGPGEWNRFLTTLEAAAGAPCAAIGHARAMHLKIQAASYPMAKRVA